MIDVNDAGLDFTHTLRRDLAFGTSLLQIYAHASYEAGAVDGGRAMTRAEYFQTAAAAGQAYYLRYTVADNYFNHDRADVLVLDNPAAPQGAGAAVEPALYTSFFEKMTASLTGTAYLFKIPENFFQNQEPVVRSEILGADPALARGTDLEEPLLGFCGMSQFQPHAIFPVVDALPAMIQDYTYVIPANADRVMLVDPSNSGLHIDTVSDQLIAQLHPEGEYTLTVRSCDGFDQSTKELQTASIAFPFMRDFRSPSVAPGDTPTCVCESPYGPPDFVFLRLARVYENQLQSVPFNAVLKTLSMDIRFQDVKTVSDLDENQLYQLTRRNSNFRADAVRNYTKRGAVLFTRGDLGNFSAWDGTGNDVFRVDFRATGYDTFNATEALAYPTAVTDRLDVMPLQLHVTFVYKDYGFSGRYNECKFDFARQP